MQLGQQVHEVMDEKTQLMMTWKELSAEHMNICSELETLQMRLAENQCQLSVG